MKKKTLAGSIATIALCASLVTGSTFALFTSDSKTDITVSSGTVKVTSTVENLAMYSHEGIDMTTFEGTKVDRTEARTFLTGGTAGYDEKEGVLTLDKIVPGDGVTFQINVNNESNVAIKYRAVFKTEEDDGLFEALEVSFAGVTFNGKQYFDWMDMSPDTKNLALDCAIEFPAEAIDDYQTKSCKISVLIEAVQGNAAVSNEVPDDEDEGNKDQVAVVADAAALLEAFESVRSQSANETVTTVTLANDIDVKGEWDAYDLPYACEKVVIEGNGHTISGLTHPLLIGSTAGGTTLTIRNLTLSDVNISDPAYKELGVGAFIARADAIVSVTMENCHVKGTAEKSSVVTGYGTAEDGGTSGEADNGYAGALIGYASCPVTLTNCSVENVEVNGWKSAGGLVGHMGGNLIVTDCSVIGCTITETKPNRTSAGAGLIMGRLSGGTATLTGTITLTGNTVNQGVAVTGEPDSIYTALGTVDTTGATMVEDNNN